MGIIVSLVTIWILSFRVVELGALLGTRYLDWNVDVVLWFVVKDGLSLQH